MVRIWVFATQTTLSIDEAAKTVQALKAKFPEIEGPVKDDTCYATQHRQEAIKQLAQMCDVVLVAGSKNSSNSNRLREVAQSVGAVAYLIDDYTDIDNSWFDNAKKVGVSAGASAPEYLVQDIIKHLQTLCDVQVQGVGLIPADCVFPLLIISSTGFKPIKGSQRRPFCSATLQSFSRNHF